MLQRQKNGHLETGKAYAFGGDGHITKIEGHGNISRTPAHFLIDGRIDGNEQFTTARNEKTLSESIT